MGKTTNLNWCRISAINSIIFVVIFGVGPWFGQAKTHDELWNASDAPVVKQRIKTIQNSCVRFVSSWRICFRFFGNSGSNDRLPREIWHSGLLSAFVDPSPTIYMFTFFPYLPKELQYPHEFPKSDFLLDLCCLLVRFEGISSWFQGTLQLL